MTVTFSFEGGAVSRKIKKDRSVNLEQLKYDRYDIPKENFFISIQVINTHCRKSTSVYITLTLYTNQSCKLFNSEADNFLPSMAGRFYQV